MTRAAATSTSWAASAWAARFRPPRAASVFAIYLGVAATVGGCRLGRAPAHPEIPAGRWLVVGSGDTLELLAQRAGVPPEDVLEINGLERAEEITPGRMIFLPAPGEAMEDEATLPGSSLPPAAIGARPALRWPLASAWVRVGSPFGRRDGRPHEGIDLPAPVGTPVFAAADGQVAYAGNGLRGYGNMLVVRHAGDILTVYAHNSVLLVSRGQPVRAGDRIALVGQSGHATGPHLHFEVRAGQTPRDPMSYLPEIHP